MSAQDSPFVTVAEVAAILRCSERKVLNLLRAGKIPAAKDYRWTVLRSDVLAYHQRLTDETHERATRRRGRGRRAA